MNVIGISILSDYGADHAKAKPVLRALHALIAQADWTARASVERDCGAIARFDSDSDASLTLDLAEAGCSVALSIHYGLGVVRILAVTPSQAR